MCARLADRPGVVEAVLGAGRRVELVPECVQAWNDTGAFQLMCAEPEQWSEDFQHLALSTRLTSWASTWKRVQDDPQVCIVLERAMPADKVIFTYVLAERGMMTREEQNFHEQWYDGRWAKRPQDIQRVGVLSCDFEELNARVRKGRARPGEENYEDSYLMHLHRRYETVVTTDDWPLRDVTVVLDAKRAFDRCDRALFDLFAQLCDLASAECVVRRLQFSCACNKCPGAQ